MSGKFIEIGPRERETITAGVINAMIVLYGRGANLWGENQPIINRFSWGDDPMKSTFSFRGEVMMAKEGKPHDVKGMITLLYLRETGYAPSVAPLVEHTLEVDGVCLIAHWTPDGKISVREKSSRRCYVGSATNPLDGREIRILAVA